MFQNNILPTDPFASESILADLADLSSAYWFGVVLGAGWGGGLGGGAPTHITCQNCADVPWLYCAISTGQSTCAVHPCTVCSQLLRTYLTLYPRLSRKTFVATFVFG